MKRLFFIIVFSVLLCICIGAFEPTVYVSGFGDDANPGTAEKPFKTLQAGFYALPCGGTIVVTTAFSFAETFEFPEVDGLITITSADEENDYRELYGAKFYIGEHIKLRGNIKFENVDFVSTASNCLIVCNGHYTCFGDGIRTSTLSSDINLIGITCAGTGRHPSEDTFVEIHSGDWFRVRGGNRGGIVTHNADVNIAIYDGTVHEYLRLAGDSLTNGNGNLYIFGGTFKKEVQLASSSGFSGDVNVSVFGGDFTKGITISSGGTIDGNLNFNIFSKVSGSISLSKGSVGGEIRINTANASFTSSRFDTYIINDTTATKDLILADFNHAKETKLKTKWSIAFHERITDYTKTITQSDNIVVHGDNGFNLKSVLQSALDVDGDGRVTVSDTARLLDAVANDSKEIVTVQRGFGEVKLYGAVLNGERLENGFAFADIGKENYLIYSDVTLNESSTVGLFFGCDGTNPKNLNGYYFEVSNERGTLAAYRIVNGNYVYLGEKPLDLLSSQARIKVEYVGGVANLYFDDNTLELSQFFDFNFNLVPLGHAVGMYVENASATVMRYENAFIESGATYTNELLYSFTDPDIFCENGVYYIYGSGTGNGEGQTGGINCYSTTDFENFKYEGQVLKKGDTFGESGFLCANIVKHGEYYYMFYSAYSEAAGRSPTACASSTSPTGPFKNATMQQLTTVPDILGGQPFVDDDGTVYLIYTRTTGGNQTYGAKVILKDGMATLDLESERFLLGLSEEWEAARASVVECGLIVKHNELYYLLYAGGNYNSTYGVGYATSTSPLGPYTKYEHNPIMIGTAQSYGVGAASVFPSADGSEYFIIHLRHFSYSSVRPLQTAMDRFRFVSDPRGGADIIEICGPSVTPQKIPSAKFTLSSDEWQSIRFHP